MVLPKRVYDVCLFPGGEKGIASNGEQNLAKSFALHDLHFIIVCGGNFYLSLFFERRSYCLKYSFAHRLGGALGLRLTPYPFVGFIRAAEYFGP